MSKKQLGAASRGEDRPDAGKRLGWFGRLRAQPGFRTASIAFVLTVVLGIGSTAAYAFWSQKNTVTQLVATERQPLPAIADRPSCRQFTDLGVVYIDYRQVSAKSLPADAGVLVSVSSSDKSVERLYQVANTGSFALRDLPGLRSAIGNDWRRLSISVTTAYLNTNTPSLPAEVDPTAVLDQAKPVSPSEGASHSVLGFSCRF